jgi:hypothetical protein
MLAQSESQDTALAAYEPSVAARALEAYLAESQPDYFRLATLSHIAGFMVDLFVINGTVEFEQFLFIRKVCMYCMAETFKRQPGHQINSLLKAELETLAIDVTFYRSRQTALHCIWGMRKVEMHDFIPSGESEGFDSV